MVMLQLRRKFATQQENLMRSIISIVLPIIVAVSISGLMFTATLA